MRLTPDLIGKTIRFKAPLVGTTTEGEVIGYRETPTLILKTVDGTQHHIPAPAQWEIVRPALEPPSQTTVTVEGSVAPGDMRFYAFTRIDALRENLYGGDSEYRWYWHDNGEWITWKQVLSHGTPKVLIPDPADSAPELPWSIGPDEKCATVSFYTPGAVSIWCGNAVTDQAEDLNPDEATAFAHAILRAARECAG